MGGSATNQIHQMGKHSRPNQLAGDPVEEKDQPAPVKLRIAAVPHVSAFCLLGRWAQFVDGGKVTGLLMTNTTTRRTFFLLYCLAQFDHVMRYTCPKLGGSRGCPFVCAWNAKLCRCLAQWTLQWPVANHRPTGELCKGPDI